MADQVIPIALSQVAFNQYLTVSKELLGRSPATGVDSCPAQLSDIAKYTASLAEFQAGKEIDPKVVLRGRGPWLRHTFYSFMVLSSNSVVIRVAESTNLDLISALTEDGERVAIFSGNLEVWQDAVVVGCSPNVPKRMRELFNSIKHAFGQVGLSDLWHDYTAKKLTDSTFYLEYNP